MHTSSLTAAAPQMETSLESKFSAAFEQQISTSGGVGTNNHNNHHHHHHSNKSQMCNGSKSSKVGHHHNHHHHQQTSQQQSSASSLMTTATPSTESTNGEKTVSFRKGNDLESFESLSSLFANGLFTDLVICCPGKMFKCHRVVMAAASLYIRDALSSFYNNNNTENESGGTGGTGACNNCNTVLILPQEIKMTDMEAILRFIYDGHVEVKVENIKSFLHSARRLNIKGLSNVNIVFNDNGTTTTTDDSINDNNGMQVSNATATNTTKNNGYVKNSNSNNNANSNNLLNGHAGMNSPPPSPPSSSPSLNSSLASLKAMTANQAHHHHPLANGNHHNLASKFLNGGLTSQLINQYRNSLHKRDHSPLRNESSILGASNISAGTNITPAHQNSTPKSIFNNGNLFSNNNSNNVRFDASNSSISSSGSASRRKQKFPTNIPFIPEMLPPTAATAQAIYNTWLSMTSEDDEEDDLDDNDDDKRLIIKDDSSNDCGSTIGDNMSTTSMDSKQPTLPFGAIAPFAPQMPCMIEVEADPTTFPTYSDFNDSPTSSQQQQKRRRHFKSPFVGENRTNEKRMKLQQQLTNNTTTNTNSNNSVDVSIKPTSPLIQTSATATSQQSSPTEIPLPKKPSSSSNSNSTNNNSVRSSSLSALDKPLFTAYSAIKTAAGANPASSSPSSSSSASASGSWVGSKWKCDICNKYYGNKQTLKEHIDYFHSNREEQIYICNICNKEYTWRKSLMKHYRDIHQMRNTPALAEINRQLAAIASGKRQGPGMSPGSTTPGGSDSNQLQSYVSIANYSSTRKSTSMSKGSSDNSEKSNKSESEMENDNTNDAVPEDEDYGNDDIEIDGSCTTDADMHDETLNDDAKSESTSTTSPEKSSSLTSASSPTPTKTDNTKSNEENEQNNNSNNNNNGETASAAEQSPASSHASS